MIKFLIILSFVIILLLSIILFNIIHMYNEIKLLNAFINKYAAHINIQMSKISLDINKIIDLINNNLKNK